MSKVEQDQVQQAPAEFDKPMNFNVSSNYYQANKIELKWSNVYINAMVPGPKLDGQKKCSKAPKVEKVLINNSEGILRPGSFTALMGPSGSGKTTLLNFLSGRLASPNLITSGKLMLNGQEIKDIEKYSNQIAYVMQDDILLATFTPREAFMFVANLRLPNLTHEQKVRKVENLIQELGLTEAANTKIGNQLIRGVSGGERKRTSIGVELLTNPSMIFLDEPTTGLDSSTALQVIELLNYLSRVKGVNIVSTIHQPSSEIFDQFQRLILLVRGNIIYQGDAKAALPFFKNQGFECPAYSNPSDFFMKLMNEEGLMIEKIQKGEELPDDKLIQQEFDQRMKNMITTYNTSDMKNKLESREKSVLDTDDQATNVGYMMQFYLLLIRAFKTEIRNPMDVRLKLIQSIVFAIASIIVFNDLGENGYGAIQNRNGVLFFLITMQSFGSIQGSLATFSGERPLFLRERLNKAYDVGPYYWAKSLAEFPFQLLYPAVGVCILYFSVGLNTEEWYKFPLLILICIVTYWTGAGYGLLLSVLIPKLEVAMALVPVVIVPLMVLGGYFVNQNTIPDYLIWLEYISMFKWGFQAAALNEFQDLGSFTCGCFEYDPNNKEYLKLAQKTGAQIGTCIPIPCDPLDQHGFTENLTETIIIQLCLGIGLRILALVGMHLISNPKRPKLLPPLTEEEKKVKKIQFD